MAGYVKSEEQIKAAEVRKLVNKSRKLWNEMDIKEKQGESIAELRRERDEIDNKANKLSLELAEYLKLNYPEYFRVSPIIVPNNYIRYIRNDKYIAQLLNEQNKKLNIHDIGLVMDDEEDIFYIFFKDNGNISFVKYISPNIIMPDNFYNFMEEMGLTIKAVNKLYELPNPLRIVWQKNNLWPNVVTSGKKLI